MKSILRTHLFTIGKAVLGMAVQIERIFGETLTSGILSVPSGTAKRFAADPDMQLRKETVIKVFEGAKDNMPDESALATARQIREYVEKLTDNDVLFVLISGGGSSLLPIPADQIELNEKIHVIQKLARSGATINELNIVRIKMSSIKGGKLALAARNAHKIVSLIISDICGDPINLIASGPTLIQNIEKEKAERILQKYNLMDSVPASVIKCLSSSPHYDSEALIGKSLVQVIGNNSIAINVALEEMDKLQIRGICMSKRLEGDVSAISILYCKIAEAVYKLNSGQIDQQSFQCLLDSLEGTLKYVEGFSVQLTDAAYDRTNRKAICIISGGEPTVTVKGVGIGGRNQELALRMAIEIAKNPLLRDVVFLSCGTDGMDGPTDGNKEFIFDFAF